MLNRINVPAGLFFLFFFSGVRAEMETVLKVHSVKKGNTLREISKKFYDTPEKWREIWEYNKYIKDPHWIFPGDDIIVPTYREKKEEKKSVSEKAEKQIEEQITENPEVFIAPYYKTERDPIDFKYSGKIAGFTDERILHAQFSKVILDVGKSDGIKKGDNFDIYRPGRKIYHPDTNEIVGILIKRVGSVSVTDDIQDISSVASVRAAVSSLAINDFARKAPRK
ncbi:MAG: LysM peptidoglycan-binding domain-containing protein [bacterium]